jgi:hypothetical protein
MPSPGRIVHELAVVARVALRARRRRVAYPAPTFEASTFRANLDPWLAALPPGTLADHRYCDVPATELPWYDTGLDVQAGDTVTWFATGRVYLSKLLDIYVEPGFQLWCRVGPEGPVFRGTRATHTFTAQQSGRVWLASYFPGEWTDPRGGLSTPAAEYAKVSGGMSVLLLKWAAGTDAATVIAGCAREASVPGLVLAEAQRLAEPLPPPAQWDYLWYLGAGEIYRSGVLQDGRRTICCHTHRDVGILRHEARLPLEAGTHLKWSWRVDALPTDLPEDTLPSHDYLSIAVEFDDGQDLTYYWSAALPVGKVYRCPLPTWKDKETHVVQRSGTAELGRWLDEERDLFEDYRRCIGGPARHVVRVWLIANSLFQRGHGRCEYAGIRLAGPSGTLDVL